MINKAFKGKLSTDQQDRIHLAGGDTDTGYKIRKFQAISNSPAGISPEAVLKIYSVKQTGVDFAIDFNDDTLLGVLFYDTRPDIFTAQTVIFDTDVVNQDIYITCATTDGDINYYLELEEVKMSKGEQAVVNFSAALLHGE